jgi:hypothetical protein
LHVDDANPEVDVEEDECGWCDDTDQVFQTWGERFNIRRGLNW